MIIDSPNPSPSRGGMPKIVNTMHFDYISYNTWCFDMKGLYWIWWYFIHPLPLGLGTQNVLIVTSSWHLIYMTSIDIDFDDHQLFSLGVGVTQTQRQTNKHPMTPQNPNTCTVHPVRLNSPESHTLVWTMTHITWTWRKTHIHATGHSYRFYTSLIS